MDSDRPTDELIQRLLAAVVDTFGTEERIDRLVAAARAEAESEVKDLLKAAIKATLLQRAVARLESAPSFPEPPVAQETAPESPTRRESRAVNSDPPGAFYVYGITRAGAELPPADVPGVDPRAALRFVREGEVQALTSEISLTEFGQEAVAERVKDLGWVEEKVRAHDRVVKEMLASGPVVPCRFGTLLRGEEDVRRVLAAHADGLAATLDALDGKSEWGVKVTAGAAPKKEGASENAAGSGRDYFLQKKRDELARADAARALREAAEACHRELSAAAASATLLPAGNRGIGDRGAAGAPEVVVNGAYLVNDAGLERFQAVVGALARRYEHLGMSLEMTGPWPPYNFVSLDLSPGGGDPDGRPDDGDPADGAVAAEPEAAA